MCVVKYTLYKNLTMNRRHFLHTTAFVPLMGRMLTNDAIAAKNILAPDPRGREFFYRPEGAWAADFIPLFYNGKFELFFLLDWRNMETKGEGTPWYRVTTNNFVEFTEQGEMLPRGTINDQDLYVFTGSAIYTKNRFHIFYTGHNPHLREQGKPEQGVMHAVSDDLRTWKKLTAETFFAPTDRYEKNDWRDPFVFWNEEEGKYFMLLAARNKEGIPRRKGLTACCSSADLVIWKTEEPFYNPGLYFTHECPDLFKMGEWWYLIFSEFTDKVRTRYRMSRSWKGPWITPERDDFDGHAFYAAKSASDGNQRFLFGWNPTREGEKDDGNWQWGGNLVVHEIIQEKNGQLAVKLPERILNAFKASQAIVFKKGSGSWSYNNQVLALEAANSFAVASAGELPGLAAISATINFKDVNGSFGIYLYGSADFEKCYYLRFEPSMQRLVFDKWPRTHSEVNQFAELERPLHLSPNKEINFYLLIEGNKGVIYVNDKIAMNFRAYDNTDLEWGFFTSETKCMFENIHLSTR